jgi:hypothetical protein
MSDQHIAKDKTGQNSIQTSIPFAGFEPAIPATKRPQTYALDHVATMTGKQNFYIT